MTTPIVSSSGAVPTPVTSTSSTSRLSTTLGSSTLLSSSQTSTTTSVSHRPKIAKKSSSTQKSKPSSPSQSPPSSPPSSSSMSSFTNQTTSTVLSSTPIPSTTSQITNSSRPNTASPNPTSAPSKHSIAPGAAAGIGVGSAIAGALIAALILWFITRSKARKSRNASVDDPPYRLLPNKSSSAAAVESSLPQPLADQKIRSEVSTLCTIINNHVISYYHTSAPNTRVDNVNEAALELLGLYAPVIASTLTALLSDSETRIAALRFCIAWVIISRIGPECEPHLTFLPPDIARCMGSMSGSSNDQPSK